MSRNSNKSKQKKPNKSKRKKMSFKKFIQTGIKGAIGTTIIGGIIAGIFLLSSVILEFHNKDIIRKQDAEIAIISDVVGIHKKIKKRNRLCDIKKYSDIEAIDDDILDLRLKIIEDTDKYRIIFGKKASNEIIHTSSKIVSFITDNEKYLDLCTPETIKIFDEIEFSTHYRNILELGLINESQGL